MVPPGFCRVRLCFACSAGFRFPSEDLSLQEIDESDVVPFDPNRSLLIFTI